MRKHFRTHDPVNTALRAPRRPDAGAAGFTLVETLIAIFIAAIISAAIYGLYVNYYRQSTTQDLVLESEQNARSALAQVERELMNAGYASGTADIITQATQNSVEFIYKDPSTDPTMSSTAGMRIKVLYTLQTAGGVQYLVRNMGICADATCGTYSNTRQNVNVIPYVQSFNLTYFDKNGAQIPYANLVLADPTGQNNRNTVKFITAQLVTQTKSTPLGALAPKTFSVETHISIRNIGIGQTSTDTTPPAAPTGVQVRDPGICGTLALKWNQNTEGDMAGYKIYYGTASGNYIGVINIPLTVLSGSTYSCTKNGTSTIQCNITPVDPALAYTPSTAAPGTGTMYYIAVKAYDNSLNHSAFSTEVYGNPATSNPTFDVGANDSIINPKKPLAVTGFIGTNGPADKQVKLNWSQYNTTTSPGVTGFRIYRSASPFSAYPIDPANPAIKELASEPGGGYTAVATSATTFTDTDPSLIGCKVYDYAIVPVNCDATLVSSSVQTDYAATCGDGTAACSAGTGFASVAGSDTAPTKSTQPGAPSLSARAGWQRVALSLTQPPDTDLAQTCVYAQAGNSYPTLLSSKSALKCFDVNSPGIVIGDNSGNSVFANPPYTPGKSTAFWNYTISATLQSPPPTLAATGTYSYSAVAFDLCGNGSNPTAAQATTTLCGEDPTGKPPAVTNAKASCCSNPVTLTWTPVPSDISSPSSPSNPYDLAGYRIFRATSNDAVGWANSVLLNPSAPYWGSSFDDTTVTDGGTYYYRIVSTDCPYEKGDDTGGVPPSAAQIRSDMISGAAPNNNLQSAIIGPVYPGRIDRDEEGASIVVGSDGLDYKCIVSHTSSASNKPITGASYTSDWIATGTTGKGIAWVSGVSYTDGVARDLHRNVLSGVTMDNDTGNGTGASVPLSTLDHHSVTLFLNNTSGGTMTLQNISVSWVNSSAFLRKVRVGGGNTGLALVLVADIPQASTTPVTSNPPYSSAVNNATLSGTSTVIPAGARHVPIRLSFFDSSGASSGVDMRGDQLLVTIGVRNDQTGTTGCVSYLTVSQASQGIFVPLGAQVTTVTQNNPQNPTFAFAVPGASGLNTVPIDGTYGTVAATGGADITVSANVLSNTTDENTGLKLPISSATLYWVETALTVGTAPSIGYTAVTMANTGGNNWQGVIPARITTSVGKRVWYYIVATDTDGNFDRSPQVTQGYYTYDQKTFNPCDYTPSAPSSLSLYIDSTTYVSVKWPRVTTYTNGATINTAVDPITYQIWRRNSLSGSFSQVYKVKDSISTACAFININTDTPAGSPISPATSSYYAHCAGTPELFYWLDYLDAVANDETYYVVAQNSCSSTANASTATNTIRECIGATTANISISPVTSSSSPLTDGGSYTVTINDCAKSSNLVTDTITINNISSRGNVNLPVSSTEIADSGQFTSTVTTTNQVAQSGTKVLVAPTDFVQDTISVSCPGCSGPPAAQTVYVKAAACDFTPAAPTGLAGVLSANKKNVILTWSANTEPDLASYKIYRNDAGVVTFLASVPAGTTTYTDTKQGSSYYVTAVDTCPLESAASTTVGPF